MKPASSGSSSGGTMLHFPLGGDLTPDLSQPGLKILQRLRRQIMPCTQFSGRRPILLGRHQQRQELVADRFIG